VFRIEVICHNNKLEKVMWALVGLVVDHPKVIPLRLEEGEVGEETNGKTTTTLTGADHQVQQKRGSGKNVLPLKAAAWLIEQAPPRITRKHLVDAMLAVGGGASADYMIKYLRDRNLMTGPIDGEFKLNAAKLSQLVGHQETPTGRGIASPQLPAYRQKVLNRQAKSPFDETVPGRTIKQLVDAGAESVTNKGIKEAITAAGGNIGSLYYVVLTLQKFKLLSDRGSDETYTVDANKYHEIMASQLNPE
jgi:hypothetical protein